MSYDIVFSPDGTISLPDLPTELLPAVQALEAPLPERTTSQDALPVWWRTRRTCVPLTPSDLAESPTEILWSIHEAGMRAQKGLAAGDEEENGPVTLLDLKVELARRSLTACNLCAHHCGVDRWAGTAGACGSTREAYVTRIFLNWSEEQQLTPGISVFLSGCNWRCVYCQYPENLAAQSSQPLAPAHLARRIEDLWQAGGTNIHWVGGNPDQDLWSALATLQYCQAPIPVVWNSNGYASITTLSLLEGVVDTHLVDFRHAAPSCAARYGAPPDSAAIIRRNLSLLAAGEVGIIVRHLQLPEHFACCTAPILRWSAAHLPEVPLNLMHGQYRPAHLAYRHPEINRRLTTGERTEAVALARTLNLTLVT